MERIGPRQAGTVSHSGPLVSLFISKLERIVPPRVCPRLVVKMEENEGWERVLVRSMGSEEESESRLGTTCA